LIVHKRMVHIRKFGYIMSTHKMITVFALLQYALFLFVAIPNSEASSSPSSPPILLRIRKVDGSVERVSIPHDAQDTTALSDVLASALEDGSAEPDDKLLNPIKCQIGSNCNIDTSQTIGSLGLRHGSLVSIIPPPRPVLSSSTKETKDKASTSSTQRYTAFDPYPELSKASSYAAASRRHRALARLPNKRGTSYSEISKLQSNMHSVEPQSDGPIKRIYMCHVSAERFKDGCSSAQPSSSSSNKKQQRLQNKCAVLFGTIHKERVNQSAKVVRTSLSTPLYEAEMCQVVKVHAVWEPPHQQPSTDSGSYDATTLWGSDGGKNKKGRKEYQRAIEMADMLGLQPIGWIYSYSQDRLGESLSTTSTNEDALPVWGEDVRTGAIGQIQNMERMGRHDGCNFITCALDARSGATEAFQLSDVTVQMVAEGVLPFASSEANKKLGERIVMTSDPIVIDGKETQELDSVLCLVNTAMLSHAGRYAGKGKNNSLKRGGKGLTAKSKKNILKKIELTGAGGDDGSLLEELCDFNLLIALDRLLGKSDINELCKLVTRYTKGQKKGTAVPKQLKLVLKSILEG